MGRYLAEQDLGRLQGYIKSGRRAALTAGVVLAGLGIVISMTFDRLAAADRLEALAIGMLCVPAFALLRFNGTIAQTHSRFALSFTPNQVFRPLLVAALVVTLWLFIARGQLFANQLLWLNLLALMVIAAVQHGLVNRALDRKTVQCTPVTDSRAWVRAGAPMMIVTMFTSYFPELTMVIAGNFLSPHDIGVFNVAFRIAFLITFGIIAVDAITTPQLSQFFARGDMANAQLLVARATLIKFCGGLVAVIILTVYGREVLALFGTEFQTGYRALVIVACAQLLRCAAGPVINLLNIAGEQDRMLVVFTCMAPVAIIANMVLATAYGPVGSAISVLIVVSIWVAWLHSIVVRRVGIRPSIFAATLLTAPLVKTAREQNPR
jgi:O-antigen/teichoic acid export membrane protein